MANLLSAALPSSDEEDDDYDPTRDLVEAKKRRGGLGCSMCL